MARQAARRGEDIQLPAGSVEPPELSPGLFLFYAAFCDLCAERSVGFGEGPIPWSSMVLYANTYRFDEELREDMIFLLRHMDRAYLKFRADSIKDDTPAAGKKPMGAKAD